MDLQLAGKRAWVLGGSSGLGLAVAEALVAEGAHVTISSNDADRLQQAMEGLSSRGSARAEVLDVRDPDSIDRAFAAVTSEGPLDIAFFNGGGPRPCGALDATPEDYDAAYQLLLRPAAQFLALVAPHMKDGDGGVIGFSTSSGVKEPIPNLILSNTMRAGVTAMAKTAASDLARYGIRVLAFAPGRIATARTAQLDQAAAERRGIPVEQVRAESEGSIPMGRYGSLEEFGRVVAFACSPAAGYLTGTTVTIDGGKLGGLLN